MRRLGTAAVAGAIAATALAGPAAAGAAGVSAAHGPTRAALVHAFVAQDGTDVGIYGVYVSGSAAVVCQKTPDAGRIRFLFSHSGRSWRFSFSTRGTHRGSLTQRRLEAACG